MSPHFFKDNILPLLTIGLPVVGLVIGAILPPFLYGRRNGLAVFLNMAGLLLYAPVAHFVGVLACVAISKGHFMRAATTIEIVTGTCLALGVFLIAESSAFLLRRYVRKSAENKH